MGWRHLSEIGIHQVRDDINVIKRSPGRGWPQDVVELTKEPSERQQETAHRATGGDLEHVHMIKVL